MRRGTYSLPTMRLKSIQKRKINCKIKSHVVKIQNQPFIVLPILPHTQLPITHFSNLKKNSPKKAKLFLVKRI